MSYMFFECKSLTNVNLSNFDTQSVVYMMNMFYGCKSLTNIDLSNSNTQNLTKMMNIFYGCESLNRNNIITKDYNILYALEK